MTSHSCKDCRRRRLEKYFPPRDASLQLLRSSWTCYSCLGKCDLCHLSQPSPNTDDDYYCCKCNHSTEYYRDIIIQEATRLKSSNPHLSGKLIDALIYMRTRSQKYRVVENLWTPDICNEVKELIINYKRHRWSQITFAETTHRYQKLLHRNWGEEEDGPFLSSPHIQQIYDEIQAVLPNTIYFTTQALESRGKHCSAQALHCDDDHYAESQTFKRARFSDSIWSIIISIEPDNNPTKLILANHGALLSHSRTHTITLRQGSVIIFRADQYHAGAAYEKTNQRIFIATGTEAFPHTGSNVFLTEPPKTSLST